VDAVAGVATPARSLSEAMPRVATARGPRSTESRAKNAPARRNGGRHLRGNKRRVSPEDRLPRVASEDAKVARLGSKRDHLSKDESEDRPSRKEGIARAERARGERTAFLGTESPHVQKRPSILHVPSASLTGREVRRIVSFERKMFDRFASDGSPGRKAPSQNFPVPYRNLREIVRLLHTLKKNCHRQSQ